MSKAHPSQRRGVIAILAAVFSVVMIGMAAFAVDIGYMLSVKEELQRTADAAALAACWDYSQQLVDGVQPDLAEQSARLAASSYAGSNVVSTEAPALNTNYSNSPTGDLVFGHVSDVYGTNIQLDTSGANVFNAVHVKVRRDESVNGLAPYFFARIFGKTGQSLEASATAAIVRDIKGFRTLNGGGNIDILPFALDLDTWNGWVAGYGDDNYSYNEATKTVSCGSDGKLEVNLYPQGTGSPGNRGTVDIGSSNNSTADICRQILDGISSEDLAYHTGVLEFDSCGKLYLNGDTGISAGCKDELAAIKGQPRAIPIFSEVNGPGNNAIYTIVKWYGIRIMDVKLTGPMNKKHVTIQAAPLVTSGVVPSSSEGTSSYVYSPVVLLQ
ncbi:hypothetical protein Pla123a_09510 [Posidoniimonas polymericola]|uniref:Flp pilus-assembly TadG-like N-terminal domain-containing protein n=1 Tax=Posidoniimonas polymericola TaxID=2528002 RepID=A0A5C5YTM6_9BACT|nr:pilus assembly protein TadG-related protein [Posidoniimonas polymericola]TWT78161.1 hypothetical protein Pla123a_09510 [Posidoniimonas polymericola]